MIKTDISAVSAKLTFSTTRTIDVLILARLTKNSIKETKFKLFRMLRKTFEASQANQ